MSGAPLSHRQLLLLAVTAFASGGTIHFQVPMLGAIAADFAADPAQIGWIPTLTFGGFFAGTLLLVPLGDRVDKRPLILGQLVLLIFAMLAMAAAPSLPALVAASLATGVGACLTQHMIALVAETAKPGERGRAMGTLLTGVFVGILFARVSGGVIAETVGWRWTYLMSAVLLMAIAVALWPRLPHTTVRAPLPYRELLGSLQALLRRNRELRRACTIQFLLAICYGGFWATVAPMLLASHGHGPAVAGLIGIAGAAGLLVARPAGRWMDNAGPGPVVSAGIGVIIVAFLVFSLGVWWLPAVAIGAVLLDCGLRAAMVANQTLATSVEPTARSRSATLFGAHMWGGNATGAWLASSVLASAGWIAVCAVAVAASTAALLVQRR